MKRDCFLLVVIIPIILITYQIHEVQSSIENGTQLFQGQDQYFPHFESFSINFEDHNPIKINGNADFSDQASENGWIGDGTESNPYIIDGLKIIGSGSDTLINISYSSFYFRISNCFLNGGSYGIYFLNVTNGYIANNIIFNNNVSIFLSSSDENTIVHNRIYNNSITGLYLISSPHCTIVNNTIENNFSHGIHLISSPHSTLINNTIYNNNGTGIVLLSSDNGTLLHNTIYNNGNHGIFLISSHNSSLIDNIIYENSMHGIYLSSSDNGTLLHNTIYNNGNQCGIFKFSSDFFN